MPIQTPLQVLVGRTWASSAAAARRKFLLACPWFARPDVLAEMAGVDAVALATIVRDEDPRVMFGALQYYTYDQLSVLCVALAAMIPTDRSPADLLGWLEPLASQEVA